MISPIVWLLFISTHVYSGNVTAIQPQYFPDLESCRRVGKALPENRDIIWGCVPTTVLVR